MVTPDYSFQFSAVRYQLLTVSWSRLRPPFEFPTWQVKRLAQALRSIESAAFFHGSFRIRARTSQRFSPLSGTLKELL
jgi:hypothetical protein